jgi:predicted choloylglycine hydrolase
MPLRHFIRHLKLGMFGDRAGISILERLQHLAMAALKGTPVLGYMASTIDTLIHRPKCVIIQLSSSEPYERGYEYGKKLRKQIRTIYTPILKLCKNDKTVDAAALAFEKYISSELIQEMRGLAAGAGFSYQNVLVIHTFLDSYPGICACSAMAKKTSQFGEHRVAAANHSLRKKVLNAPEFDSYRRRQALMETGAQADRKVLKASNVKGTIQSICFDTRARSIKIAVGESYAAKKKFKFISEKQLFTTPAAKKSGAAEVKLYRNLDWPWYFLGQNTIVLMTHTKGKNQLCRVTFPGYLGTLSGMNDKGLSLAVCSREGFINQQGTPNPLLFTSMLESCASTAEAMDFLKKNPHGSSMNVMIADPESAVSVELGAARDVVMVGSFN